ncbi:MAG: flagellar motor protein MotB [bacterium]|nr:MAG: flagellar motor protein MotB [bacterium]
MAAVRKKKTKCPQMAGWMTTFMDMTTLLLTFFILMFTVAEIDGDELKLILSSFTGSFGVMPGGMTLQKGPLAEAGMTVETLPSKRAAEKLAKAFKEQTSKWKSPQTSRRIKVTEDIRGYVISIPGQAFFEPDKSEINDRGKELLGEIARLLLRLRVESDTQVEIEGHASLEQYDGVKSGELSSQWERNLDLSTDRAKNVEKFFIRIFKDNKSPPIINIGDKKNKKYIAKFIAKGYGEFEPLESDENPEARASNRRVDIIIKRD